ncbi:S-methyl-5'-thioadenosine phosphorylase [Candidatus Kuenenbacteria bacterium CG_4_9_14_3_um_filter_39_14]|uniref:Purine nucleoside phosphorylase n=6 Tax=Candidatus Kueneniibacteriota TaxID=1752740 RepID=A0A2M7ILR4_9BACT|nr:S-methyl-5'-thioadenosine phosphorylase [Candidatus Kuenenbacteria bacterium]OIP56485.1 MAG: methylthioadenosine phosphorylase [Candidatus Kuenenbacteria bacterium CG2_30_39_24]PIP29109.1 MAG: S-methyl-5'-thioadenosine phosphorylase [Candidatus Kuenenbacteria bacterium CG23_combo_of_CG06-09_8_20_14_all_39_39]PIP76051.1 MAG: S-methyl-5'-thioadenosine phosphorylase [Candidatus Kuenenbacteria bacterium CG22_combo_CG10-13_8_21_14_all_39_9]PIR80666.1 MAG: S-methyl-5'-thioadenosine phosphorylase [
MKLKNKIKKIKEKKKIAEIGVIGGSGFYKFLDQAREISIRTPFGQPSEKILVGTYQGKKVAFLSRHGKNHHLPPHKIPYQANIWALKMLGVERIITSCTAGSLQSHIKPGDFVITDHFVDRTKHRDDTFFHGPEVAHFSMAEPYCPTLRKLAAECCKKISIPYHKTGTIVVIEGPRFSTKPESRWFSAQAWDVVNMTHYPEVVLARELDICLVNIALVTDWDVGLEGNPKIKPVTTQEILGVFKQNVENVKELLSNIIPKIPKEKDCGCWQASESAFV